MAVSLVHVANAGATGTGGSISKVAPSLTCLGLASPWPPSPHVAFQSPRPFS